MRNIILGLVGILVITGEPRASTGSPGVNAVPDTRTEILESGRVNPARYFGPTLANGMIGILATSTPLRTEQTLISGAYETLWPGYVSCIVSTFNILDVALSIDGQRIERFDQVRRFNQSLQLKDAVLTTSFDFGDKASITYKTRALRHLPFTALLEVSITAKRPLSVTSAGALDLPASLINPSFFQRTVVTRDGPSTVTLRSASAETQLGRHKVAAAQSFIFDLPPADANQGRRAGGSEFSERLAAGATLQYAMVASTLTSAHVSDPLHEAERLTAYAAVQGTARLIEQHEQAWHDLWKSRVVIDGDDQTQRDVNSMLYHLYSSLHADTNYSIPPMGLTRGNTGYLGHIFWDSEIWMVPTLLALNPGLARPLLEYRYQRLSAAKRNAGAHGYQGAMYPWESSSTGDDDTPPSAITSALQHHVTAGVGIAAWNYYRVTKDLSWLRDRGYPVIKETADFWASRVTRNGQGRYDITNVVAADEYAENVDNDAYTNAAARRNLAAATAAARVLNLEPNPDWEHVRENIPILKFPNGITREHATYNGEAAKQADVSLLAYPLNEVTDRDVIRRDLEYYDARIDHLLGPAMTKSIMATLYQRLGLPDKAYDYFKAGLQPNKRPPFGLIAENATSPNPYFVTGAAGLLQTILYGFGGLDITDDGLVQLHTEKLPSQWKSLTLIGIGPEAHTFVVN